MLVIHNKAENAAAGTASEAVKSLPARTDGERRRFLLMKWAERLEIRSRTLERKIRAYHLNDVVRGSDLLDVLRRDQAHGPFTFRSFAAKRDAKLVENEDYW